LQNRVILSLYQDAVDVQIHPNHLTKTTRQVKNGDKIKVDLASGGGMVMEISPTKALESGAIR